MHDASPYNKYASLKINGGLRFIDDVEGGNNVSLSTLKQ
jgi:hypothetical protein